MAAPEARSKVAVRSRGKVRLNQHVYVSSDVKSVVPVLPGDCQHRTTSSSKRFIKRESSSNEFGEIPQSQLSGTTAVRPCFDTVVSASFTYHQTSHLKVLRCMFERLPVEVIRDIFVLVLLSYPNHEARSELPIQLSSVCRLFYRVAIKEPKLWTSFGITIS